MKFMMLMIPAVYQGGKKVARDLCLIRRSGTDDAV